MSKVATGEPNESLNNMDTVSENYETKCQWSEMKQKYCTLAVDSNIVTTDQWEKYLLHLHCSKSRHYHYIQYKQFAYLFSLEYRLVHIYGSMFLLREVSRSQIVRKHSCVSSTQARR